MQWLVVILLMSNVVLFVFLWRSVSGQQKKQDEGPGELVHDNMMMQGELKDFSDELLYKIDTRIAGLQKLIKEADDRISTLDAMELPRRRAESASARKAADTAQSSAAAAAKGGGSAQRRTAILSLARKGLSSDQIAQEVGMGRGEVEFIINIEKQRNS